MTFEINNLTGEALIHHSAISAVTAFILQVIKRAGLNISKESLPILSVIIGSIGNFVMYFTLGYEITDFMSVFVNGALAGLTASGGYDTAKGLTENIKKLIKLLKREV